MTDLDTTASQSKRAKVGLILPGGGARSAYQVGVLKGIAEFWPLKRHNPFPVITGTSAGAINATVLAASAMRFHAGVDRMVGVWSHFSSDKVFRSDGLTAFRTALHWIWAALTGGLGLGKPSSLLNNTPLRSLLENQVNFARIQQAIDAGALDAIAITASSYHRARSVSFFQAREGIEAWSRARREGQCCTLDLDHLMASVAIPVVFPAVWVRDDYYGDGSMRQAAPLSSAIHLGAERLLVIGLRSEGRSPIRRQPAEPEYPNLGSIAGYMLDTLFMDSLYSDLERLTRINQLLADQVLHPGSAKVKEIQAHVVIPSEDILEIAARHAHRMPRSVRFLLRGLGAANSGGLPLVSYLLFEQEYCQELIALGYRDALAQREQLMAFLSGEVVADLEAPDSVEEMLSR
jgi:NTE family protein